MLELLLHNRTAMNAQQQKMDSISNNIANQNTVGYKREDVDFSDLIYDSLKRNGYPTSTTPVGEVIQQDGTGVRANGYIRDNKQGELETTGMCTDLTLDGRGYFKVTRGDGTTAYERNGNFNLDSNGKLVDKNGNVLEINFTNGTVPLTYDNFMVREDGTVGVKTDKGMQEVGKIDVYDSIGQASMLSIGDNLCVPKTGVQMFKINDTSIRQGFVEKSNVDLTKEMTDMITTQRSFQLNSKCLTTADEMWQAVNNMVSK